MAAIAGTIFFLAVLVLSGTVIVETARPRMGRILFLLRHGPLTAAQLPAAPRVMVRGRSLPLRVTAAPRLRAAA